MGAFGVGACSRLGARPCQTTMAIPAGEFVHWKAPWLLLTFPRCNCWCLYFRDMKPVSALATSIIPNTTSTTASLDEYQQPTLQPFKTGKDKDVVSENAAGSEKLPEDDGFNLPMEEESSVPSSPFLASASLLGIVALLGGGYLFKDQIKHFLTFFIGAVDQWGPLGYAAYAAVYTGLEVLAVPAIPLTMTAGVIFGPIPGTMVVSASGTVAATIAFLIARYAARDKVCRQHGTAWGQGSGDITL